MSNLVKLNIVPGIKLPHNVEGVQVSDAGMLVEMEVKQRLMTLRPHLFHKSDPDWPSKVERVEIVTPAKVKKLDATDNPS